MTKLIFEIIKLDNDFWTLLISLFALISTILIGFKQNNLSKKQIKIESKLNRFENQKGEVLLASILYRYFVNFISRLDISNPKTSSVKTDLISTSQYTAEMESILSDLTTLMNNPFLIKIIEKYPELNRTIVQLRRDSVKVKIESENTGISQSTFLAFYDLFYVLKKNSKDSKLFHTKEFKNLESGLEQLIKTNPSLLKKI